DFLSPRQPPPRGIDLSDSQAVVVEQPADVVVAQTVAAGAPVVASPQGDAGEAAGDGGADPVTERDVTRQRPRAEDEVVGPQPHQPTMRAGLSAATSFSTPMEWTAARLSAR